MGTSSSVHVYRRACLLLASILATSVSTLPSSAASVDDLQIAVTTDRLAYLLTQPARITLERCNPTAETISVTYGCYCCRFLLDVHRDSGTLVSEYSCGGIQVPHTEVWSAGECKAETETWPQDVGYYGPSGAVGTPAGEGSYYVRYFSNADSPTEILSPFFVVGPSSIPSLNPVGLAALGLLVAFAGLYFLRKGGVRGESA